MHLKGTEFDEAECRTMFCSFVLSDLRESLKQVLARQMFLPTACLVRTVEEMVKGEILTDHT